MDDMKNIIGCEFNDDNGCVEVAYKDGNFLKIKCEEVEAKLRTTEQSLTKLHRLLENNPIEYVAMVFQARCKHIVILRLKWLKICLGISCRGI